MNVVKIGSLFFPIFFGLALFVCSFLMFTLEPFIAKLLLPSLGGSPNVWNTSVLFFQLTLVAGYLYAHLFSSKIPLEKQKWIHLPILLLPLLATSFIIPPVQKSLAEIPVLWLLISLTTMIGALFFSLSTVAPLLQRWYSNTVAPGSDDPYFLYAASNAGSILGLISYPLWVESNFSLKEQGNFVYWCYLIAALLILAVSFFPKESSKTGQGNTKDENPPAVQSYLNWLFYSSIPASLMLGVTTYVSTELSALPFFWVVPLLIYLLTFVIAFARPPLLLIKIASILGPLFSLAALTLVFKQVIAANLQTEGVPVTTGISIHLLALFFTGLYLHGKLASGRPASSYLTGYFLTVSIGGVLGSSLNTFLAPLIFAAWIEYPLVLCLASMSTLGYPKILKFKYKEKLPENSLLLILTVSGLALLSWNLCKYFGLYTLLIPVIATLMLTTNRTQLRSGLAITLATLTLTMFSLEADTVYRARNFFGCLRINLNKQDNTCQFWHGITIHGVESLDPDQRGKPQAYFHSNGPIGELLSQVNKDNKEPLAVVGLGAGSLAAYANQQQKLFFYEINPDVIKVASNPFYFTYLYQARKRGVDLEIVEGDGRLKLMNAPYKHFRMIILDAFNSDSIPTHLLTREALLLYKSKLKEGGCLAFQVTNNYYDLKPLIGALAKSEGFKALSKNDYSKAREKRRFPTEWVLLTKNQRLLEELKSLNWKELKEQQRIRIWTDDYSNPIKLLTMPFS